MKQRQLLILIIIGIVLAGGVFLIWKKVGQASRESNQKQLAEQVSESQSQSAEQNEAEKEAVYPQHIVAIPGSDQVWYEIPELGVRMKLNKEFAEDLIYSHEEHFSVDGIADFDLADFSLKSLMKQYPACGPTGPVLGEIIKLKDEFQGEQMKFQDVKKISRLSLGSQDVCWYKPNDPTNNSSVGTLLMRDGVQFLQTAYETLERMGSYR